MENVMYHGLFTLKLNEFYNFQLDCNCILGIEDVLTINQIIEHLAGKFDNARIGNILG